MNGSQIFLVCFGSFAALVIIVLWLYANAASNEYNRDFGGGGGW